LNRPSLKFFSTPVAYRVSW